MKNIKTKNDIYEIVKEFEIHLEDILYPIKAKIIKLIAEHDEDIRYDAILSHYCKQDEKAIDTYYPSFIRKELNAPECLVINYLENFKILALKKNERY